jgi:exopolysaccharide biosynthesis WecB/TagA/CpsF family protein
MSGTATSMAYRDSVGEGSRDGAADAAVVRLLGLPFAAVTFEEAVARIRAMLADSTSGHQVVLANAHTVNLACDDPTYHQTLQRADLVLRDGVGVEIGARLLKKRLAHNFVGTDFVPLLLRALATPGVRVFLYGAVPDVATAAAKVLQASAPGIEIVGAEDGYGPSEDVMQKIQASHADVLLVALGNPRQEQWIAANLASLNVRVAIGVGALFDFLAQRVPRAPQWMRRARVEWVYRLYREPRRLWRRYVVGNTQFLWRVARAARMERT